MHSRTENSSSLFESILPRWKSLAIIAVAVFCVYGQTLRFGFINYDDDELVYHNTSFLSHWENIGTAFSSHAFIGAGGESIYYRPLLTVSYIIDFQIWGLHPLGYHLTNILLHILTSIGVFFLILMILRDEFPALAGALLFALHPIQTESVAWIAGRNDLLLGLFVVAMMVFYVASRNNPAKERFFCFLSALSFLMAIFTKESAAFYALLLPLYDLYIGNCTPQNVVSIEYLKKFRMIITIVIVYCGIRLIIFGTVIGAERLYGHRTIVERIVNIPPIVAENLKFIVLPANLSVAHPLNDLPWFLFPWNIVALMILVILIAGIVKLWRKDRLLWLGMAWIVVGFLPLIGIIPVAIPILEHRLYASIVGFAIVVARIVQLLSEKFNHRTIAYSLVVVLGIILAVGSYRRLPVWSNGITLFTDAVQKAPSYTPSYFSLAGAYYEAQRYAEAIQPMNEYVSQVPNDPRALTLLREIYYNAQRYDDGANISRRLILLEPRNSQHFLEAGMLYEAIHKYDSAAVLYREGLDVDTTSDELCVRLAGIYQRQQRLENAETYYRRALQVNPLNTVAPVALANIFITQGKNVEAINILEQRITAGKPTHEIVSLLQSLYTQAGDLLKADQLSKRFHL